MEWISRKIDHSNLGTKHFAAFDLSARSAVLHPQEAALLEAHFLP
jgi:hypothetical protein